MSFNDVLMGKPPQSFQINGGTYEIRFVAKGSTAVQQVGFAYQYNGMLYMIVDGGAFTMPVNLKIGDNLSFEKLATSFSPGSHNFYLAYKDQYGANTKYWKEPSVPTPWDGS